MPKSLRTLRAALAAVAFATLAHAQLPFIVINEMNCDTPGTDTLEFVEFFTIPGSSLAGYTLVFFNGATAAGPAYFAMDLTGVADVNGLYVVGNTAVLPAPAQTWADNLLQNGQDGIGLFYGASASAWTTSGAGATSVATPPVGAILVDAVVYGTDDPTAASLLASLLPGFQQINEGASGSQLSDLSIGRCPDGSPNALDTSTYVQMPPTPGAFNTCIPPFRVEVTQNCPGPITLTVTGATPGYELYNLIALTCSSPAGSGLFFGINSDLAAGSPLIAFTYPLGAAPFHVAADASGQYVFTAGTSGLCPSPFQLTVEVVTFEGIGLGITRVTSQTSGCVILDL
jgi:hypothetical protein